MRSWNRWNGRAVTWAAKSVVVIKNEADLRLKICLAFPDVYEIGMSHLGLKILYGLINQRPDFWAERALAVWPDREQQLRRTGHGLRSLESGRLLADFDVVGFSLQYELTYTNILTMLELGGIPLAAGTGDRNILWSSAAAPMLTIRNHWPNFLTFSILGMPKSACWTFLRKRPGGKPKGLAGRICCPLGRRAGGLCALLFRNRFTMARAGSGKLFPKGQVMFVWKGWWPRTWTRPIFRAAPLCPSSRLFMIG